MMHLWLFSLRCVFAVFINCCTNRTRLLGQRLDNVARLHQTENYNWDLVFFTQSDGSLVHDIQILRGDLLVT